MDTYRKVEYFDILNALACLCVIGMHCNGIVHEFDGSAAWAQSMVVETLAYWAVPVFFMLSGATMMNYRERYSTKEYFKRRWKKAGIPFLFWTIVIGIAQYISGNMKWSGIKGLVEQFLNCQFEPVYWFFIPLFMIYLCMPVLTKLYTDRKVLWYLVGVGVFFEGILPFLHSWQIIAYNSDFRFPMTSGYILYPILGYLIHTTEIPPKYRKCIYILGGWGAFFRYTYTYLASFRDGTLNQLTWGYLNWPSLLLSVAIFVFIKYAGAYIRADKLKRGISKLARASFGVYLIHVLIMEAIITIFKINVYDAWWRFLGAFIVYGVSWLIVRVLQKMPGGNYILP